MSEKQYTVRAAACDHRTDYKDVYETLKRITEPLTESWTRITRS